MSELKGACIFGQSGGPTSVINASAYGVIATALKNPNITRVLGAEHGIKGVLNDRLFDMGLEDPEEQLRALGHIIKAHLSVAQTDQYIDKRLAQLQATPPSGRRVFLLKDVRLFLNSLDRGLRLVREAGIGAESRREDTEDAILLTIRIPKSRRVG